MAKRGMSLSFKLIAVSTALLVVVIGLFGTVNSMQSRRIIDDAAKRMREAINARLRSGGTGQLQLFTGTARFAIMQSDYTTLEEIVVSMGKQADQTTAVAVIDKDGIILAHSNKALNAKPATGVLKKAAAVKKLEIVSDVEINEQKSITFAAPIDQAGTRLGTVFLAYSLSSMEAELKKAEKIKQKEVGASVRNTAVLGVMALLLGVLLTIVQGIRISRPIRALAAQADQIASGDLQARVEVKSHDEIGFLGDRFNSMAEQVLLLMRETKQKATMEKELEVASAIQSTLVPSDSVVDFPGLSLAGYFKPATQCGGDWWSYYKMKNDKVLVIIGDVTGHGVASAMITAAAQGAATTMMAVTDYQADLKSLLGAMNVAIHDAAKGKFVMTCFASIYDPADNSLEFANAGHNFPYMLDRETGKLVSLVVRGNRLGDLEHSEYEIRKMDVDSQKTLVWYTDGIVECEDARGEEYGEKRFRRLFKKYGTLDPDRARDEIVAEANKFFGDVPQKDDITMVIGRFG